MELAKKLYEFSEELVAEIPDAGDGKKDVLKIDFEPNNCCIKALYK